MHSETEVVLAEGRFEQGSEIFRGDIKVYRVPPRTHQEDDAERIIDRKGLAIIQVAFRENSDHRPAGTGDWTDVGDLGPLEGLEFIEDQA